jgi:ribosomal protein S18 acetylase RimI-like enzyme
MQNAEIDISEMSMDDYAEVYALWQQTEGVGLSSADEPGAIARYLDRNPGLSFVARQQAASGLGLLVGAVLGGHDGRRGFLHHLAVRPDCRGGGIGRALTASCLAALAAQGIQKTHIFVYRENAAGRAFWEKVGWEERKTLVIYSR